LYKLKFNSVWTLHIITSQFALKIRHSDLKQRILRISLHSHYFQIVCLIEIFLVCSFCFVILKEWVQLRKPFEASTMIGHITSRWKQPGTIPVTRTYSMATHCIIEQPCSRTLQSSWKLSSLSKGSFEQSGLGRRVVS
jgi:hypothetical protein